MKNKKIILIGLSLLAIYGFLSVKIAYNFSSPHPIVDLDTLMQLFNPSNWKYINLSAEYQSNFFILYLEIILSILLFIFTIFIKKSKYILYSSMILFVIWFKNMILFREIIQIDIYAKSSILFLVSLVMLNILIFSYKNKAINE
ncbi:hypothetical protein LX74_00962 [Elizabethkingia miricola]|uniref:Exosortase F system-associated protein n=1 Tax=Elizabethkingia miricola TaxID=172045 RepID=A0ABY3NIC8_ELIMR|nr:hypothetical protein [Elizabethkingia miricola]TYO92901.1 hypothetical protein LX74_00962 [Elizabethkingia miricola]